MELQGAGRPGKTAVPLVAGLLFACLYVLVLTTALRSPAPHDVPVGLVSTEPIASRVENGLQQRAPRTFTVHRRANEADAERAIADHDDYGAFVVRPDAQGGRAELLIAGASGMAATQLIRSAFTEVAASAHLPVTVRDLAPLPASDPNGTLPFLLITPLLLAGVMFASVTAMFGGNDVSLGARVFSLLGFAATVGAASVGIVELLSGGLAGSYWALAGVAALFALALSGSILALHRLLGLPGLALGALMGVLLGNASSGGTVNWEFLPDFYRALSQNLPAGSAVTAARSVVYFGGHDVLRPLAVLAIWGASSIVVLAVAEACRKSPRPAPAPPRSAVNQELVLAILAYLLVRRKEVDRDAERHDQEV